MSSRPVPVLSLLLVVGARAECWRDLQKVKDACRTSPCSDACIGRADDLFRRWDTCADVRDGLVNLFDKKVWDCFNDYSLGHPYVCAHMALFSKICRVELTSAYGSVDFSRHGHASSAQCARVQDGCTGNCLTVQFPILLDVDECASHLEADGGTALINSYISNCSDSVMCAGELEMARTHCAVRDSSGSCTQDCRARIDSLFSSADAGSSWATCQGVRVSVPTSAYDKIAGIAPAQKRRGQPGAHDWTTFGREAVSLYTSCFGQCTKQEADESSLLYSVVVFGIFVGPILAFCLSRRPALAPRLALQDNQVEPPSAERNAILTRSSRVANATIVLSTLCLITTWAGIYLPIGVVAACVGVCAGYISRTNLPRLAQGEAHAAATPDCCGGGDALDPHKWIETARCCYVSTAALGGVGSFVNFLLGMIYVGIGEYEDTGLCHTCSLDDVVYCSWEACFEECDCGSRSNCCTETKCVKDEACGMFCQVGRVCLLSVPMLMMLMALSITGAMHCAKLRIQFRLRATDVPMHPAMGPVIEATVVQAEPVQAQPVQGQLVH